MCSHTQCIAVLLNQITVEMKKVHLWQVTSPSQEQLSSSQPFAIDCLEPQQWLQWVLIPKMHQIIDMGTPLPQGFEIFPYFEQCWSGSVSYHQLLNLIQKLDELCHFSNG